MDDILDPMPGESTLDHLQRLRQEENDMWYQKEEHKTGNVFFQELARKITSLQLEVDQCRLKKLKEAMTCGLCNMEYTSEGPNVAVNLGCNSGVNHVFCRLCILQMALQLNPEDEQPVPTISCPTCRQPCKSMVSSLQRVEPLQQLAVECKKRKRIENGNTRLNIKKKIRQQLYCWRVVDTLLTCMDDEREIVLGCLRKLITQTFPENEEEALRKGNFIIKPVVAAMKKYANDEDVQILSCEVLLMFLVDTQRNFPVVGKNKLSEKGALVQLRSMLQRWGGSLILTEKGLSILSNIVTSSVSHILDKGVMVDSDKQNIFIGMDDEMMGVVIDGMNSFPGSKSIQINGIRTLLVWAHNVYADSISQAKGVVGDEKESVIEKVIDVVIHVMDRNPDCACIHDLSPIILGFLGTNTQRVDLIHRKGGFQTLSTSMKYNNCSSNYKHISNALIRLLTIGIDHDKEMMQKIMDACDLLETMKLVLRKNLMDSEQYINVQRALDWICI